MRLSTRSRPYICLPCQLKAGRPPVAINYSRLTNRPRQANFSSTRIWRDDRNSLENGQSLGHNTDTPFSSGFAQTLGVVSRTKEEVHDAATTEDSHERPQPTDEQAKGFRYIKSSSKPSKETSPHQNGRSHAAPLSPAIKLTEAQQREVTALLALRQRLTQGLNSIPEIKKDPSIVGGMSIDDILSALPKDGHSPIQQKFITRLGSEYSGQKFTQVRDNMELAGKHRVGLSSTVTSPHAHDVLVRLGVINDVSNVVQQSPPPTNTSAMSKNLSPSIASTGVGKRRQSLASMVASQQPPDKKTPGKQSKAAPRPPIFPSREAKNIKASTVEANDLVLSSIVPESPPKLPQLSFDLSRVLFNPGIYQLQDPRSRVYNFDPYLEQLMPVSQFKFDALNPYLTSSEDKTLDDLARDHGKRYVGSSSSMTAILSQFHFLLSHWRPLNFENLSRGFGDNSPTFTVISRSPAAIFLRYKDGIYAVDADKEYDEPSVLMSFGHMMEKLLTLEKNDFEKWRKTNDQAGSEVPQPPPEAFHFSQQGRFLLRSQLDVHDPRLPGTGYFDLKTRAVAGIRMNIREHEAGLGYQIKERYGTWESYEREYYDMARSTFLKYSLQARMGNMDGIFVAYHNITRTFGFQYIPLTEMDTVLHGQSDTCLGDQEFRFSINFLEEIFNMATEEYPQRSLRIHFEAREGNVTETKPYMNIFIEPMAEERIKEIQNSQKAQFESFERSMLRGEDPEPMVDIEADLKDEISDNESADNDGLDEDESNDVLPVNNIMSRPTGPASNAANTAFLDSILNTKAARTKPKMDTQEVMCLKLTVQNKVNGRPYASPTAITPSANWTIDYNLERRSEEQAAKLYRQCRNRRMAALKTVINRGSDNYFIRSIRQLSERGAEWRKQQDELDAQREQVVLYGDRRPK